VNAKRRQLRQTLAKEFLADKVRTREHNETAGDST
jgi:hypothetical protein